GQTESNSPFYLTFVGNPSPPGVPDPDEPSCIHKHAYVIDLARPDHSTITRSTENISWESAPGIVSPGDRYVALLGQDDTAAKSPLFIKDLQGRFSREEMTATNVEFAWSADGKRLAYVWQERQSDGADKAEVVIVNADDSQRQVTAVSLPASQQLKL